MRELIQIPLEIWEKIFCSDDITIADFIKFCSTCSDIQRKIGHSNKIWEYHFCKRYEVLGVRYFTILITYFFLSDW